MKNDEEKEYIELDKIPEKMYEFTIENQINYNGEVCIFQEIIIGMLQTNYKFSIKGNIKEIKKKFDDYFPNNQNLLNSIKNSV